MSLIICIERCSAVIKPLSESETGKSWGERRGSMMTREQSQNDKSLVEQCNEMEIPRQESAIVKDDTRKDRERKNKTTAMPSVSSVFASHYRRMTIVGAFKLDGFKPV